MLPHWTQGEVMVGGDALHYYRTGAGEKPALVLAHGFSDNGLCWLPVARDLESDYDVILPDARGHGKSQRIRPGEPLDQPADLANLIRGLGLSQVVVGGHSMGGRTATEFGARFPELARALLLEDPAWRLPKEPAPQAAVQPEEDEYSRFLRTARDLPVEAIIARCRKNDPRWPEVEHYPWAISKQQFDPNYLAIRSRSHPDWREMAAKIRCPVLLITSEVEQGAIVTVEVAELAMKINPRIEVAFIPDAGHNIRRDNFLGYMTVVKGFLQGLDLEKGWHVSRRLA